MLTCALNCVNGMPYELAQLETGRPAAITGSDVIAYHSLCEHVQEAFASVQLAEEGILAAATGLVQELQRRRERTAAAQAAAMALRSVAVAQANRQVPRSLDPHATGCIRCRQMAPCCHPGSGCDCCHLI